MGQSGGTVYDPMAPTGEDRNPEEHPERNLGRDARLVVTGVAAALLVWFAVANLQDVDIHFWLVSQRSPLIVVIAISGLLGSAVTLLAGRLARRRRQPD